MFGLVWGNREPRSDESIPTNVVGSLGSLGIEWGYKIRPEVEEEEEEREEVATGDEEPEPDVHESEGTSEKEQPRLTEEEGDEKSVGLAHFVIDKETAYLMMFRETLDVFDKADSKYLGHFSISADAMGKSGKCFIMHLSGRATLDGVECGTTVTGCVDRRLNVIDETRFEFEKGKDFTREKHLYIAHDVDDQDGHYLHIVSSRKIDDFEDCRSQDVPFDSVKNLVSEGSCMLLMRFMAIKGFTGIVDLTSVLNNAAIYKSTLTSSGPFTWSVRGRKMQVFQIQRNLFDASGKEQVVRAMLNRTGRMLEQVWLNGPYAMYVSPLANVANTMPMTCRSRYIPLYGHWKDDMQTRSLFLDEKTRRLANNSSYFVDHPEIKKMIADFVQALLLMKPKDTLPFAIQHFAAFKPDTS